MAAGYQRPGFDHLGYGTFGGPAGLLPVVEGLAVFGPQALGPNIRSNGYPSPATLPAGAGGDVPTFGTMGGGSGLTTPLIIGLLVAGAIGIFIVHRATWR